MQSVSVSWQEKNPEEPVALPALRCVLSMPDTKVHWNFGGSFLFPTVLVLASLCRFSNISFLQRPFLITLVKIKAHKSFVKLPTAVS